MNGRGPKWRAEDSPEGQHPASAAEEAYAGRWVARVQGKVIAQGGTPDEARRAAQAHRHKERVDISYVQPAGVPPLSPLLDRVAAIEDDTDLYLVGGSVRDILLGKVSHDFDLLVPRDAIGAARHAAKALGADFYVLDEANDAARVIVEGPDLTRDVLDFTSFRGPNLETDLGARDLTINSIALDLKDRSTHDPFRGAADLKEKLIRACSTSAMRDDPIRVLRAVRLAGALDFKIEAATRESMRQAVELLPTTSAERQRDEFFRILGGPRPATCLRALELLGVLQHTLPELSPMKGVAQPLPHVHDVWRHALAVVQHLAEDIDLVCQGIQTGAPGLHTGLLSLALGRYREQFRDHFAGGPHADRPLRGLLLLAALYHDAGKPLARTVEADGRIRFLGHEQRSAALAEERGRQWNLSNAEIAHLREVVGNHMRFFDLARRMEDEGAPPSRRAIYRFFQATGPAGPDVILLGLADVRGTREQTLTEKAWTAWVATARCLLEALWERPEESVMPRRLVDGHELMRALGIGPGRELGELLEFIHEAQAAGEVSTADEAIEAAETLLRSMRG
jgi:tRNA nucleotidyltransferase/poly(A) polymerase